MITITGMDDFPTNIAVFPFLLADGRMAIAATHERTPGTMETAYSAAYLVDSAGHAQLVGTSERAGKDIAPAILIFGTTLRLIVSEALPGGGGATARVDYYDFPIPVGLAPVATAIDHVLRAALAALPK